MDSIVLNEEEISTIKSLVEEVANIPVIECIYAKSVINNDNNESKVEIRVLLSDNVEYNTLIQKLGIERDVKKEVSELNALSKKYVELFGNITDGNCILKVEWSNYYVPWFTNIQEELADEELVNGTILYDRFGNLTYTKNIVGKVLKGDPRLPIIENIDEVANNKKSSK